MKKTVSTILGLTMTMALAGVSLLAQSTPAGTTSSSTTSNTTVTKTPKKSKTKHAKNTAKVKSVNKTSAATTAK